MILPDGSQYTTSILRSPEPPKCSTRLLILTRTFPTNFTKPRTFYKPVSFDQVAWSLSLENIAEGNQGNSDLSPHIPGACLDYGRGRHWVRLRNLWDYKTYKTSPSQSTRQALFSWSSLSLVFSFSRSSSAFSLPDSRLVLDPISFI